VWQQLEKVQSGVFGEFQIGCSREVESTILNAKKTWESLHGPLQIGTTKVKNDAYANRFMYPFEFTSLPLVSVPTQSIKYTNTSVKVGLRDKPLIQGLSCYVLLS
jgi:hypothetical protein